MSNTMRYSSWLITAPAVAAAVAWIALTPQAMGEAAEGSFDRTLTVSGRVDLAVDSGAGRIRVHPGAEGTVKIRAELRGHHWLFSSGDDLPARIREIEAHPPIQQDGNRIVVGRFADGLRPRHVSISYDITVPNESALNVRTGSGGVEIGDLAGPVEAHSGSGGVTIGRIAAAVVATTASGGIEVGGAASLEARSGSGSVRAQAIAGPTIARSGSGGVRVAQSGKGDVDVSSSSGQVTVTGVEGAAQVSASSGGIVVEGRPVGAWNIHSSSGGVTVRLPADAAFDLDAHVGSGRIESSHPITTTPGHDRHRLQGQVRGGGPRVEVRSSSGGIRLE